jgi:hypothetical protein
VNSGSSFVLASGMAFLWDGELMEVQKDLYGSVVLELCDIEGYRLNHPSSKCFWSSKKMA